jgi:hypothetical protein
MKSLRNIYSFDEFVNEEANKPPLVEVVEHYMFFENLKTIKKNAEKILEMDATKVDETLKNGHDWAADHVAVANDNLDQVADFLANPHEMSEATAVYVSPQEKERQQREAEARLREQVKKIMAKIKSDPEKGDIHKMELDIANAKLNVFALQKQLKVVKERYAKMHKK